MADRAATLLLLWNSTCCFVVLFVDTSCFRFSLLSPLPWFRPDCRKGKGKRALSRVTESYSTYLLNLPTQPTYSTYLLCIWRATRCVEM
ncbi:hypothetical protein BZA05DRAFT_411371 [Tricharina praecox]|uniref:uncharacterized protein n=1 Tax=Tricharina praecox TaxID=43433 RepID=UPI00221ED8EA|nr:uncharacterized protein BZA05DRAFT_411371 [Tricharina praecox]KAI5843177.1 hypothetical protein BZA05DRAFT_411371 [Tricharina praecox]